MTTLWLAFAIYILGVALVLFFRPAIMFRPGNGTWREFGLANTGNYTVFPFWMFTLLWAIVSYVLATLGTVFIASAALQSMPMEEAPVNNSIFTPVSKMPAAAPAAPAVPAPAPTPSGLPGYYVLDSSSGPPKYVYFGTSPPTLANI